MWTPPQGHRLDSKRAVGSVDTVRGDVLRNLGKVLERLWMEYKTAHARRRSWLIWSNPEKASSPSTGVTRPLLMSS